MAICSSVGCTVSTCMPLHCCTASSGAQGQLWPVSPHLLLLQPMSKRFSAPCYRKWHVTSLLLLLPCAGMPFSPDFAVTHITQLSGRPDDEQLRAGPTPWGTVLQLPASWAEAVASADLPDEHPLCTAIEVGHTLLWRRAKGQGAVGACADCSLLPPPPATTCQWL